MPQQSLTQSLAKFAHNFSIENCSPAQVERLTLFFLDWLGCSLGGRALPPARMMQDTVRELGGAPESTCLVDGSKSSCLLAALSNGCASHVLEMDDLHRGAVIHPGAVVAPAALAMAERAGASGRELLRALAVGQEIFIRVALGMGETHYHFWHTTATCGVFGAAAAAACLLGLDREQTVWALGNAGTQSSGLWSFLAENTMTKTMHPGQAAASGILAALLAQRGFTGPAAILEGDKGLFRATSRDFDPDKVTEGLGEVFQFERSSLKYHASCGHTHASVDAALDAVEGFELDTSDVAKVEVLACAQSLQLLEGVRPETPHLAKFSLEYCVASALLYGPLGLDAFAEERLRDTQLLALTAKVDVRADEELSSQYPTRWPARVRIHLQNGHTLEGEVKYPKGDPENALSPDEVRNKFMALARITVSDDKARDLAGSVMGLREASCVTNLLAL